MKWKPEHLHDSTLSAQATKASHTYHMLLYDFVTDMESKRGPTRGAHLEYLDDLVRASCAIRVEWKYMGDEKGLSREGLAESLAPGCSTLAFPAAPGRLKRASWPWLARLWIRSMPVF